MLSFNNNALFNGHQGENECIIEILQNILIMYSMTVYFNITVSRIIMSSR